MAAIPTQPHSTRLENLHIDAQGASLDLEGRPVRLVAAGYAAPVASMQELYHHALADYYQRSAELSRAAAERHPPLLGRLLSWVGRFFSAISPVPQAPASFPPVPPPPPATPPPVDPPGGRRSEAHLTRSPQLSSPLPAQPAESGGMRPSSAGTRAPTPPILHVVFADRDGVHVIWQVAGSRRDRERAPADATRPPPRLELTYGLDSAMAQRLQDCYGQLAQLGYRIADLGAVRAAPEKSAASPGPARAVASPAAPEAKIEAAEQPATEPAKAVRPRASPRPARPAASPGPVEPSPPVVPPPARDPGLLPGM